MKKLFLSSSCGYNWNQIKNWNLSAKRTGHDVANILINPTQDIVNDCVENGVIPIVFNAQVNKAPHNLRFLFQYKFLKSVLDKYDLVMLTDSRDVYFSADPFPKIEYLIERHKKDIICGSESILYKNEHWGNSNLMEGFPYIYDEFKENEICNVGVLCGKTEAVADLCLVIFSMCVHNPASVSDQSSFNILMGTKFGKDLIYMSTPSDGFIIQMGTVASSKFAHHIIDKVEINYDELPSVNGVTFPVIHQYDRFPYTANKVII